LTSTPAPAHLNHHHRDTLSRIFQHPVGHNIDWQDVLSLLRAVATIEEVHGGRYLITLGPETETFEPPKHKDIDAQQVVDLRRMLKNAGYGPEGEVPEGAG
jgi:thiamine biosynthesis lipoprotein ApbE